LTCAGTGIVVPKMIVFVLEFGEGGRVLFSPVVNTKSCGACVSVSMAKEAIGAEVGGSEKRRACHFVQ
jgi:hypothetical protein